LTNNSTDFFYVLLYCRMITRQNPQRNMIFKNILFLSVSFFSLAGWHTDLNEAKQIARKEHRHILLNFSGSDWCGPCIRMRKEMLDNGDFTNMADSLLVLVNADFPRMKKNQLSATQQKLNDAMADQYNSKGKFPFTVLLNADGKVLKEWDGFPEVTPEIFINDVRHAIYADQ